MTQAGFKAVEELAKLDEKRGTPEYTSESAGKSGATGEKPIRKRESGGDYCAGNRSNVYQYIDGGGVL